MKYQTLLVLVCLAVRAVDGFSGEGFFDSDGVRIHYLETGKADGPPVLLIHGYMASASLNWRVPGMIATLSPDYRVIALDNRGHGQSDKPTTRAAYGPHMASDSVRLLDHLGIKKAHVVGYSMGGMITLYLAAHYPDRLRSAGVTGMGWIEKRPASPTQIPRATSPALKACIEAFPDLGISKQDLQQIKTPMEIIIGSADNLYERRVKPLSEVRPDVPVTLINEATHVSCIFRDDFKTAVKAFLDRQPK